MKDRMLEFVDAATGQTVSALRSLKKAADDLWVAATKAGDKTSASVIQASFVQQTLDLADKLSNPNVGMSDAVKQINDLQKQATQFIAELGRLGITWINQGEIMRGVAAQVDAINAKVSAGLLE